MLLLVDWKNENGEIWYPDNSKGYDKIPGTESANIYNEGDTISRMIKKEDINDYHGGEYSVEGDRGGYVAPVGTPFELRGLEGNKDDYVDVILKIKEPLETDRSIAAPWFDKESLGVQDKLKQRLNDIQKESETFEITNIIKAE